MPDRRTNRPLAFLALAVALGVTGCGKPAATADDAAAANPAAAAPLPSLPATLPMATGPATAPAYAPAVAALPAARPVRAVRVAHSGDTYAYADDAYAFSNALGNAPPDYGFDYQGAEPWAWQGTDESRTFVEPVSGGGYRYYYYRPGADTPYFVRDPDYGYGYDNGALAVIYGAGGAVVPYGEYGPRLGYASRYLQRGAALYAASRGNARRAVVAANWAARRDSIAASRDRWAAAEARQAGWQAYRARVADQQAQHWAQEAARRDADAQRFATWHDNGFRSAPPPRAIPVAWQRATWARDQQSYRPIDPPGAPPRVSQPAVQRPAAPAFVAGREEPSRVGGEVRPNAAQVQAAREMQVRQQAAVGRQQQEAARLAAQQAVRKRVGAEQAERQQRQVSDLAARQQQPVARQAEREQRVTAQQPGRAERLPRPAVQRAPDRPAPVSVDVHRGVDTPFDGGRPPRSPERSATAQPAHEDHRSAVFAQRPAIPAVHQQQVAVHQQAAVVPHAAPLPQSHPAPTPRAPAPHPQGGGGHGERGARRP